MCLALRLCAREAQGVDVLRAIAVATCVAASKHVGIAALQGEGDRKHEAPLGARAAPIVVLVEGAGMPTISHTHHTKTRPRTALTVDRQAPLEPRRPTLRSQLDAT